MNNRTTSINVTRLCWLVFATERDTGNRDLIYIDISEDLARSHAKFLLEYMSVQYHNIFLSEGEVKTELKPIPKRKTPEVHGSFE